VTEDDIRYRAVQAKDARFDGWFFVAVTSTGIYCRPSCASVIPGRARVRFYPTAAAAQRAGFRACKRCRPDASPGSPEWDRRNDAVARAMRAIADGVVDREGVRGLATRLGYSTRQLGRLLISEVGAGPLELARAQRAQTARILLETTSLRASEVAFAAGFGSVRQFNDTVRQIFAETPTALRRRVERAVGQPEPGSVNLRLAFRPPLATTLLFAFLAARAVPGVEEGDATYHRRALRLPYGAAVVTVLAPSPGQNYVQAQLALDDLRDLTTAAKRVRQMLDLDADPASVSEVLGSDAVLMDAIATRPGLRVPGHVDGEELAVRALLGQQVSVTGARSLAGRLAARHGHPLARPHGAVLRNFPAPAVLGCLNAEDLPVPVSRARAIVDLSRAIAEGKLDLRPGTDRDEVSRRLLAIHGLGPWTVAYVRMRALADPDAFPGEDLALRRALAGAGLPTSPAALAQRARAWRPYRAYACQYLWSGALGRTEAHEGRVA